MKTKADFEPAELLKSQRNHRAIKVARSMMKGNFDNTRGIRILCECGDFMCRELITMPGTAYNVRSGKSPAIFVLPDHGKLFAYKPLKKTSKYWIVEKPQA